jgi:hypothetical protein
MAIVRDKYFFHNVLRDNIFFHALQYGKSGVDITGKRIFSANKTVSAPLGVPSRLPGEMLLLFISLGPSRLPVFFLFFHRKER